MANYSINNAMLSTNGMLAQTGGTGFSSLSQVITVTAQASNAGTAGNTFTVRRGRIYDLLIGSQGTPADAYAEWNIARMTVNASSVGSGGLSISSAIIAMDQADTPTIATAGPATLICVNSTNHSTSNYTTGGDVFDVAINQRASYRWVAAPGSELVWPAVSCAGFGVRVKGSMTTIATAMILVSE